MSATPVETLPREPRAARSGVAFSHMLAVAGTVYVVIHLLVRWVIGAA